MTVDSSALAMFVLGQLVTAAGVYAAIRADLREALVRVAILEKWRERLDGKA